MLVSSANATQLSLLNFSSSTIPNANSFAISLELGVFAFPQHNGQMHCTLDLMVVSKHSMYQKLECGVVLPYISTSLSFDTSRLALSL